MQREIESLRLQEQAKQAAALAAAEAKAEVERRLEADRAAKQEALAQMQRDSEAKQSASVPSIGLRCSACNESFGREPFLELQGGKYHRRCMVCYGCSRPLEGSLLMANDRTYHPECLKCAFCSVSLQNQGFATDPGTQVLYCGRHSSARARELATCGGCRTPIFGMDMQVHDNINFHSMCLAHVLSMQQQQKQQQEALQAAQGFVACQNCGGFVEPAIRVDVSAQTRVLHYHAQCFGCAVCRVPLANQPFQALDQGVFCAVHALR
jgi:hypothetical protein